MNITLPPWRFPQTAIQPQQRRQHNNNKSDSPPASSRLGQHYRNQALIQSVTSPTRQASLENYNDSDEDDLRVDAISAALDFADEDDIIDDDDYVDDDVADIDVETLGMTNERQNEIQGSLFRMLGHESHAASSRLNAPQVAGSCENEGSGGMTGAASSDEK